MPLWTLHYNLTCLPVVPIAPFMARRVVNKVTQNCKIFLKPLSGTTALSLKYPQGSHQSRFLCSLIVLRLLVLSRHWIAVRCVPPCRFMVIDFEKKLFLAASSELALLSEEREGGRLRGDWRVPQQRRRKKEGRVPGRRNQATSV